MATATATGRTQRRIQSRLQALRGLEATEDTKEADLGSALSMAIH